ncbi:hypothetical protein P4O66_003638 [Electrophorus voltai]|uniref:Uncharacterized protein n=1 Tax=Electrophorus voltai TaxID=2609070 RepID=A0AAD8ZST2_9TELE|nr:hypothetical protein P4O66_003638 [Electrophorus voltai]
MPGFGFAPVVLSVLAPVSVPVPIPVSPFVSFTVPVRVSILVPVSLKGLRPLIGLFQILVQNELTLQSSPEAVEQSDAYKRRLAPSWAWSAERVREEAKDHVVASGGDPGNARLVLSESTVQFRQYWGQTFKWVLTDDMGYTVMVLAAHQQEREGGTTSIYPAMVNKDALVQYASLS